MEVYCNAFLAIDVNGGQGQQSKRVHIVEGGLVGGTIDSGHSDVFGVSQVGQENIGVVYILTYERPTSYVLFVLYDLQL